MTPFFLKYVLSLCRVPGIKRWCLNHLVAITENPRLGGLNNKHLLLTVLEAGKSKIKVLEDLVSGESRL